MTERGSERWRYLLRSCEGPMVLKPVAYQVVVVTVLLVLVACLRRVSFYRMALGDLLSTILLYFNKTFWALQRSQRLRLWSLESRESLR